MISIGLAEDSRIAISFFSEGNKSFDPIATVAISPEYANILADQLYALANLSKESK